MGIVSTRFLRNRLETICHFERNEVESRNLMGSLDSLRAQGFRPFLTENEHTGSFSGRAEPRDDIRR